MNTTEPDFTPMQRLVLDYLEGGIRNHFGLDPAEWTLDHTIEVLSEYHRIKMLFKEGG